MAPYAPGGPVVAAPSGQTAAYRDGATGQVFVRQPVNIIIVIIIVSVIVIVIVIVIVMLVGIFSKYKALVAGLASGLVLNRCQFL